MSADSRFASRLRWWRKRRAVSQLELAHAAQVSQRHVSFLEIARTAPSRDMVLRLAAAMLLGEPVTLNLVAGLIAVLAGLWMATAGGGADDRRMG